MALFAPLVPSTFFGVWVTVWVKPSHEAKDGRILDRGKPDVLIPPVALYQYYRFSLYHCIIPQPCHYQ